MEDKIINSKPNEKYDVDFDFGDTDFIKIYTYDCLLGFGDLIKYQTPHIHSYYEFQLCLEGQTAFIIGDKRVKICKNQFLIIPPFTEHRLEYKTEDLIKFTWSFSIDNQRIDEDLKSECDFTKAYDAHKNIVRAVKIMHENSDRTKFETHNVIKCQQYFIFVSLMRELLDADSYVEKEHKRGSKGEIIKKFIFDNIATNPSIDDIAEQFFYSKRQLDRILIKEYGMTTHELKKRIRIDKVKALLVNNDLSLDDVAKLSGFSDRYAMSKELKRAVGCPPAKYRQMIRE